MKGRMGECHKVLTDTERESRPVFPRLLFLSLDQRALPGDLIIIESLLCAEAEEARMFSSWSRKWDEKENPFYSELNPGLLVSCPETQFVTVWR